MTKIHQVLEAFASGEAMTYYQVSDMTGVGRMAVTTYARRLQDSGYLAHQGYEWKGRYRFAKYQITEEGLSRLSAEEEPAWKPSWTIVERKGETAVERAIRTQPNSVFALGELQGAMI